MHPMLNTLRMRFEDTP